MTRYWDWQTRLDRFIIGNSGMAFSWGSWDCSLWVASAIQAMTGIDVAAEWRGKYSTEEEAQQLCKQVCGDSSYSAMADFVAKQNQMQEVSPLHAQRGDMVSTAVCLGIVGLDGRLLVLTETGLTRVDYSHIQRAWRVG